MTLPNGEQLHDLYKEMVIVFQNQTVVVLYLVGCLSLSWHLLHGFQSAFRTFGVSNGRYLKLLNCLGTLFAILVPLAFAMMPISMYLGWVK
jgi:succinate dehydrogenase / fumarate reductase cytochrome b subunit